MDKDGRYKYCRKNNFNLTAGTDLPGSILYVRFSAEGLDEIITVLKQ
ncbi:MAG: hypothetical protein ABJA78_17670 [Ferruginibacter sp.]